MSGKAILCVDDEAILLLSLKRELQQELGRDYLIETALNAPEADEVIEELTAGGIRLLLVISDWLMPGIRGDEFLIGVHRRHPDVKAIIITGHADPASIERLKADAAIHSVFSKPWNKAALLAAVRECIE